VDINSLPDDPATLKGLLADMAASQADQQQQIAQLEQRIRLLNLIIYGSRSEKKPHTGQSQQFSLFDEAEQTVEEQKPQTFEEACAPVHTRGKRGRRPIPADLPRVEVVHDLPETEKTCPCGALLVRIGEEVSEKLDIVPATIRVIRHIRPKYACRNCEGVDDDGPTVKTAPMPPQIIPQGIVTPGLLAHVAIAKYADALPLYRQEDQFMRLGLDISRGTLASWMIRVAKACEPLIDMIIAEIRSGPIVNMDETTVQVMHEPDRANTAKSYMWVARGGTPGKPVVLFRYHPTRAGAVAEEILGDFKGYLQTDGYGGYEALGEREGLRHLGCLAHVRRKFVEVEKTAGKKAKGGTAHAALDLIGKLYGVEHQAEKQKLDPEQIKILRAEKSRPILDKLKALLDARVVTTPPKSVLGRAIGYALKQWRRLVVYLEDGRLRPDNNLAENAIRPFAVGRKNWLFSGHPRGADASATIYSLIETAKANGLEPYRYLRHLFEHLPAVTSDAQRKALLPQHINSQRLIIPA